VSGQSKRYGCLGNPTEPVIDGNFATTADAVTDGTADGTYARTAANADDGTNGFNTRTAANADADDEPDG